MIKNYIFFVIFINLFFNTYSQSIKKENRNINIAFKFDSINPIINFWPNKKIGAIFIKVEDSLIYRYGHNYVGILTNICMYKLSSKNELIANGLHYHFTDQGVLSHIYTYLNGELDGYYKSYFSNGSLESIGRYSHGNKIGIWIFYNEKCQIVRKINYNK